HWVQPLDREQKDRLTPGANPFWEHGEGRLFTAWRGGVPVGRVSAQIDHNHLRRYDDGAGFFGFFDTVDDAGVAQALLARAEGWLRARGMTACRGPFSLNINEEVGCLVEGSDTPPMVLMGHHAPWQGGLLETAGYAKVKDLYYYLYDVPEELPPRAQRAHDAVQKLPEVRFRSLDKRKMRSEVTTFLEIFNDAWQDNWGFVPATDSEAAQMASDFGLLADPELAFFAEVEGEPVAFVIVLPNLNEAIAGLRGKLFPFGWAKLLGRLKIGSPTTGRLIMLGIKQKMRGKKRYGALSTALYAEVSRRGRKVGIEQAALGWTLEDNQAINLGIRAMKAKRYKTYRIYEKAL
ncbi:MAG: hypothetical protein AAF447_24285, partial [Myxococcota bacterium]